MLLDHFFADGKPQPGASGLGRESGFEDAGHGGGIDPVALILKVDLHESPGPAPDRNGQRATTLHGVKCVQRQIEENLLQPVGVGRHRHSSRGIFQADRQPALPRQRAQKFGGFPQQAVEVRGQQFAARLTVELQDVIHGRGKRAQAGL